MFNKLLTYLFFLLFLNSIIAQNYDEQLINKKVDSINSLLKDKKLSPEERIDNLEVLVDAYIKKNDLDNSLKTILNIKKLAIEIKDTFSLARAYKGFAIISSINANSKKEIKDLKKAIMLFKSLKNHTKKNEYLYASYYHIANTYVINNNYGEANKAILNAYDYILKDNEGNSKYLKIDLLNLQGYINSEIENNSEALINLKEALVLETEINDDYGKANTYNAIAIIHSKQKNETKALIYYQLALDIFKKLGNESLKGMSYNNIGISYYELKNYTKAEDLLLKSIEISKKLKNKGLQSDSYLYLGKCNIAKNNIDLGLQNISKSLQLALEVNSPSLIIDNLLVKAEVANKYNNTTQAIVYLNESLLYIEKSETIDLKKRVYKALAKTYEKVNSDKATFYNKKFICLKNRSHLN
ncbi:MAG: tetratricopeptide repeat protein [Flavobacteriaceae bacterium]|nr:tetratricopeptide repeat protein [Flavobacteriaceae bacterium]